MLAVDATAVEDAAGLVAPPPETLDEMIERFAGDLVDYQSRRYADRYRASGRSRRTAEQAVDPDSTALTDAVARNLYKLMAYKDEYEVARLLLLDESRERYEKIGGKRHEGHLSPAPADAAGDGDEEQAEVAA